MTTDLPRVLALDLGSSSVRAVVFDSALRPLARSRRPVAIRQRSDGAALLDPHAYLDGAVACVDELHEAGNLDGVGTVATACQWHSLLPLERSGAPAGPGLSWMDTRAAVPPGLAPDDPFDYHQRTGAWWHTLYWPLRIAWLNRTGQPAARWSGLGGHLSRTLLGEDATTVSEASGTGALDTRACRWDPEAMELAGVEESQLPPLAPDGFTARLRPDWARRWPALAGAAWALPIGDGAASTIGGGCAVPGRVSVTVGTSAAVRRIAPGAPVVPELVWRYRVDRERSVLGVALSAGGVIYDWVTGLVGEPDEAALAALPPGGHGLVTLPFAAGHRPPRPADGSGTVHGLRLATTGLDLVAAALEGVCHELADAARLLPHESRTPQPTPAAPGSVNPSAGPAGSAGSSPGAAGALRGAADAGAAPGVPVLGGGAVAASPWFARRLAAAFGGSALRCPDPEVGARGAAALATGLDPAPTLEPVEVGPEEVALMVRAGEKHRNLRRRLDG